NPVWQEDLEAFERERQSQITAEISQAVKEKDVLTLESLRTEVELGEWHDPPPPALVRSTVQALERLRKEQARHELEQLERQLNDAFASLDASLGRSLRAKWQTSTAVANLQVSDPLSERAAPALDWLMREDQRQQREAEYEIGIQQLERALDDNLPVL